MTNVSSVCCLLLIIFEIVILLILTIASKVLVHHLSHFGLFIFPKHWKMFLIQVHLRSIKFPLQFLILLIRIINLFIYFLFESKIISHILSIIFDFCMALTFSVEPLVCVFHVLVNTIFLRVVQTHFI